MFQNLFGRVFFYSLAGMLAVHLLSLGAYYVPGMFVVGFLFVSVAFACVALWRIDIAVLIVLGELMVGSQGRLFEWELSGFNLSLRMTFFALLLAVALLHRIRGTWPRARVVPSWRWIAAVLGVTLLGAGIGLLARHDPRVVFLDANGYAYLFLGLAIVPILFRSVSLASFAELFAAAVVFLSLETGLLLALFAHQYDFIPALYHWLRDTRMFEITAFAKNFFRVFNQSDVYSLFAVLFFGGTLLLDEHTRRARRQLRLLVGLALATLIISFSRSFWLALSLAVLGVVVPVLFRRGWRWRSFTQLVGAAALLLTLEFAAVSFLANYPYVWNRPGGTTTVVLLQERSTDTDEPALAARYDLLKPLFGAIARSPVLGSGFGASLTFQTHDPRVVARTGGIRTAFAFEWGYLDQLLKVGFLGMAVFVGWLTVLGRALVAAARRAPATLQGVAWGLCGAFLTLIIIHVTTPYLNHPLGLGFLLMLTAFVTHQQSMVAQRTTQ